MEKLPISIDYDVKNKTMRSEKDEWRLHKIQTDKSFEWWYLTMLVQDTAGNSYFLFWLDMNYGAKKYLEGIPQLKDKLKPGQNVFLSMAGFTDYTNELHYGGADIAVMNESDCFDETNNAKLFTSEKRKVKWALNEENSRLSASTEAYTCELLLQNAKQVMYAKDKYNVEGFIQEGEEDDFSFYWSMPRMPVTGTVSFKNKDGKTQTIDVTGQAWIDRQWGDFLTRSWEWGSFRFNNGARLNLYNFANGYQVATYQKADGSLQWFDHFLVKQNGYAKTPQNKVWFSWGWSYEFPIEIEGTKYYTVKPFSKLDTYEPPGNNFFEGPGKLYNDETGICVGISVNESMDLKVMKNAPYEVNQHN